MYCIHFRSRRFKSKPGYVGLAEAERSIPALQQHKWDTNTPSQSSLGTKVFFHNLKKIGILGTNWENSCLIFRILTCIWDSMVTVLSVPLTGYIGRNRKQKIRGIITKKINTFGKRKRIAWEGLTIQCLEGLHKVSIQVM